MEYIAIVKPLCHKLNTLITPLLDVSIFKKYLRLKNLSCVQLFKKSISGVIYCVNRPSFMVWLTLLLEILGNTCIASTCRPVCDHIKFGIILSFLIKPLSHVIKKTHYKNLNILRPKRLFNMKYKAFFLIFKELSLKQKQRLWRMSIQL